jgi:diaminopimelate decarboxylase
VKSSRASQVLREPAFRYSRSDGAEAVLSGAERPRSAGTVRSRASGNPFAELNCESVALEKLATRHGTPLYVYSAEMIRSRLHAFAQAFRSIPHTLCYSVKANSTLAILRIMAGEPTGFDVVSGGELQRVLRVSRKAASKVVFSGVGKSRDGTGPALRNFVVQY